jgi:signal transduction histidine kinase
MTNVFCAARLGRRVGYCCVVAAAAKVEDTRMEPHAPEPAPAAEPGRWRPWWIALGLWLALAAMAALALWHLRSEALDGQTRELALLSLALTDELDRGLQGAEEGLRALRAELADGQLPTRGAEAARALRIRADLMPLVETLWLLDAGGQVMAASEGAAAPPLASFWPALERPGPTAPGAASTTPTSAPAAAMSRAAGGASSGALPGPKGGPTSGPTSSSTTEPAPSVSRPFAGPAGTQSLVALALPFVDLSGGPSASTSASSSVSSPASPSAGPSADAPSRPAGWIVAALPARLLLGAFSTALPAADAKMAVFRADGALLAAANLDPPRLDEASLARRLEARPNLEVRRLRDGSEHLVGLHGIGRYGIKVMVTRQLGAVLAAWRGAAELAAAAGALLLAVLAVSVHYVQRADRRRSQAQRALQAQRSRASKLESLGTLAGGVAHDFNNVLAGIVGFGEMAQDAAAPGSAQARHLDKVLQAALRGKALVDRILAFSRGGAHASTVFELEPVVEEVLNLLAASLRPGVVLERALDAGGARLRGDPTQAFEAIMNLCTNAMQAMPRGGMLSVQLERVRTIDARVLSHSRLAAGDHVALSVADQGEGITAAVMERLFEPFFTTRGAQSGTGLGLAVVHGVVAEFGGALDVQSAPGQGARFTLYFPECTDAAAPALAPAGGTPGGAGQALLVVDDETDLVALAEEMLTGLGYRPVGYADPTAALQALLDEPQRFAAVITDEVMPRLSGTQLTRALRERLPQLPVLLVSGYGGALLARRAAAAGVTRVLAKPLRRAELSRVLAEVLARGPA